MLRNGLQNSTKVEKRIDRRDLESTGRYIMYFEQGEKIFQNLIQIIVLFT